MVERHGLAYGTTCYSSFVGNSLSFFYDWCVFYWCLLLFICYTFVMKLICSNLMIQVVSHVSKEHSTAFFRSKEIKIQI
jgi:hypothetical protein